MRKGVLNGDSSVPAGFRVKDEVTLTPHGHTAHRAIKYPSLSLASHARVEQRVDTADKASSYPGKMAFVVLQDVWKMG